MWGTEEISGADRRVSSPQKKSGGGRGTLEKLTLGGERMWLVACLPKLDCRAPPARTRQSPILREYACNVVARRAGKQARRVAHHPRQLRGHVMAANAQHIARLV